MQAGEEHWILALGLQSLPPQKSPSKMILVSGCMQEKGPERKVRLNQNRQEMLSETQSSHAALCWCPEETLLDLIFPRNVHPTGDGRLAPSTWGPELLLGASSNTLEMSLPAGRDGQKGQAKVQDTTWDFGDQESGLAFLQT